MHPEILIQTLISGLFVGGIYAAYSMGLTLIYGVMYLINFAHGEFLMLGMYTAFWLYTLAGFDPYLSAVPAGILLFIFGMILQYIFYRPILKAPILQQVLLSLGVSSLLIGLAQFFFDARPRSILMSYSGDAIKIGALIFNIPRTIAFMVALVLCIILFYFLKKSKIGKAMRACTQSSIAAKLMGIDVEKINMLTFGIGAALVGIAGAVLTPSLPMSPTVGLGYSISGFVIVVLGSLGNVMGAFVASLIIGVAEAFGGLYFGSVWKQVVSLGIFIIILLFKPEGLFGRKGS